MKQKYVVKRKGVLSDAYPYVKFVLTVFINFLLDYSNVTPYICKMKAVKIYAIFCLFVLITPLIISSVIKLQNNKAFFVVYENGSEEEKNEKDPSSKEGVEDFEDFIFSDKNDFRISTTSTSELTSCTAYFPDESTEILGPPPKLG